MKQNFPTEEEIRMTAFSVAICNAIASVAADTVILRQLLHTKKLVLDDEFDAALEAFQQTDKWKAYRDKLTDMILRDVKSQLAELRGPVN